ncbi:MAG: asparaginase domain-containing protein [Nanoarchaeota archaeon]
MLKRSQVRTKYRIESSKLIDSLEMQEEDYNRIAKACMDAEEDIILISHGTDMMVDTVRAIARMDLQKTIILFGAMIPYPVTGSDALFNLGFALAAVQTLPSGTYIGMNGKIFLHNNVKKNKKRGIFESLLQA